MISKEFFDKILHSVTLKGAPKEPCELTPGIFSGLYTLGGEIIFSNSSRGLERPKSYYHQLRYMGIIFQCTTDIEKVWEREKGIYFFQDDADRQKKIALLLIKRDFSKKGIPGERFNEQVKAEAVEIGFSEEVLLKFYESLLPEVIEKIFRKKNVVIDTLEKAPSCSGCGSEMIRRVKGWWCPNCYSTSGCD